MAYYSIVATARQAIGIEGYLIAFDKGLNVVTVVTNDFDALVKALNDNGVTLVSANRLDDFEDVTDVDIQPLEGLHGTEAEQG